MTNFKAAILSVVLCITMLSVVSCTTIRSHAADDLNPVTFHKSPQHEKITLVKGGKAKAEIVVFPKNKMLRLAVRDLQRLIKATTGAELPIVKKRTGIPAIVIGQNPIIAKTLPIEGFVIKTGPNTIYIVGNDEVGTTWGVNEFLERFVGVRWYWPEEKGSKKLVGTSIIPSSNLVVKPVWITDQPVFRKRHRYPPNIASISADLSSQDRHLRCYNSWPIFLRVHTPYGWDKFYKKSRPEIFQLRSDGGRDYNMLCYGNKRTLETYLEEIKIQLKAEKDGAPPNWGRMVVYKKTISVSPADLHVGCRCVDCRALWETDAGDYGTASVIMAKFVEKLAKEVKKRWPDLTILYLPYLNYTYFPGDISFPDNVEIQICGMPGLAQYKDASINKSEQDNIDAWFAASGRKIQNWHYSCWPENRTKAAYLFPNVIKKHYQQNRNKTVGTFINGTKNHWARQHVSLYVWLKVLWNPEFNVDAAVEQYTKRMYGPAAADMQKLVNMLITGWEKDNWSNHVFSPKSVYEESYPRKNVIKMEKLLEKAFASAKGDKLASKRLNYYAGPLREFFTESKQYADGTGIKPLIAKQVVEDPKLDGKLTDSVWKNAQALNFVMAKNKANPTPKFTTTVRAVWTRRGITFGFHMLEPTPDKLKRDIGKNSRDEPLIWWNDNVEIFLDVTGQRSSYYQFIVTANTAILDSNGKDKSWTAQGLKTATHIGKDFWSLEVFVPYSTFKDAVLPGTGVEWYGNFTRHRVTDKTNIEYQRLSTKLSGPSNDQNAFVPIKFIE